MLKDDEEILFQNIVQVDQNCILIFPLKDALKLEKCISVRFIKDEKPIYKIYEFTVNLNRPGISLQKSNGKVTDIIFLGGNEDKMCHYMSLSTFKPTPCGRLPLLHLVTDQLNV